MQKFALDIKKFVQDSAWCEKLLEPYVKLIHKGPGHFMLVLLTMPIITFLLFKFSGHSCARKASFPGLVLVTR
jgi:hypothetical protein